MIHFHCPHLHTRRRVIAVLRRASDSRMGNPEIVDHSPAAGLERPYLEIYNSFRYSRIMHPEELPDVKLVDGLREVNRIVFTAAFPRSHQLQRLFVPCPGIMNAFNPTTHFYLTEQVSAPCKDYVSYDIILVWC